MAIAYRSQTSTTYASRTNTVLTAPAGLANDDILIALVFTGKTGTPTVATPPAGFTAIGTFTGVADGGGFEARTLAWWKRAASESGSYTFTHVAASSQGLMLAYSGCITSGSPIDVASQNTGTGTTTTGTGVTTTAANAMVLALNHDWEGTGTLSPPSGMTERFDGLLYAAEVIQASAGATGNKVQTNANTSGGYPWAARVIALKEAAGGPTNSTGSASGTGTASGVGASNAASTGSATAAGTATATGRSLFAAVGTATGGGTATGVGVAAFAATGSAAGTGVATGVATAIGSGVGSSAGIGSASGIARSQASSVGSATGVGTAGGVAASLASTAGSAAGASTVSGVGAVGDSGSVGTAIGSSTVSGVGASIARAVGTAAGTSSALGLAEEPEQTSSFTSSGRVGTSWAYKTLSQIEKEKKAELARIAKQAQKAVAKAISKGLVELLEIETVARKAVVEATPRDLHLEREQINAIAAQLAERARIAILRKQMEDDEDDSEVLLLVA